MRDRQGDPHEQASPEQEWDGHRGDRDAGRIGRGVDRLVGRAGEHLGERGELVHGRLVTLAADRAVDGMEFRNMGSTVGGGGIGLEPAVGGARTLTLGVGGITLRLGGNLEIRGTANGDFTLALGADQIWRNFEGGNYVFVGSASTGNTALDLAGHALALAGVFSSRRRHT